MYAMSQSVRLCVRLSVYLSVKLESRLNCSRYQNMLCTYTTITNIAVHPPFTLPNGNIWGQLRHSG